MKFWLVVALFLAEPAHAFTLLYSSSGNLTVTGWGVSELSFDVDTSCNSFTSEVQDAIGQALDLWDKVPSSNLRVSLGKTVTLSGAITTYVGAGASQAAPAGNPIVYCDTNFSSDSGEDADSIPGFASSQNVTSSGQLRGGLLVLNFESGGQANIQTLGATSSAIVLAHEIGHILGLGHSADVNALMYYATGPSRALILAQDDIDGISYLYPRQEPGHGGLLGCATVSASGGGGGGGGGLAEFCMLLAVCAAGAWLGARGGRGVARA